MVTMRHSTAASSGLQTNRVAPSRCKHPIIYARLSAPAIVYASQSLQDVSDCSAADGVLLDEAPCTVPNPTGSVPQRPPRMADDAARRSWRRTAQRVDTLLAEGRSADADAQLWEASMRLRSMSALQAASDELQARGVMRPAAVAALLVQLGKLTAREQRTARASVRATAQEAHAVAAAESNRQRQRLRAARKRDADEAGEAAAGSTAAAAAAVGAAAAAAGGGTGGGQGAAARAVPWPQQHVQQQAQAQKQRGRVTVEQPPLHNRQQQARRQPAATQSVPSHVAPPRPQAAATTRMQRRLLLRLVTLLRSDTSHLTPLQLGVLPHWLVRLQVADSQLLRALHSAALEQQLPASDPRALVPMLWGVAKAGGHTGGGGGRGLRRASAAHRMPPAPQQQLEQQQQQQQQLGAAQSGMHEPKPGRSGASLASSPSAPLASSPSAQQQQQPLLPAPQAAAAAAALSANTAMAVSPPADGAFVGAWLSSSAACLGGFTASQLATSLYSLALLRTSPPPAWRSAYWAAATAKLPAASAQDLSNTLWALGTLRLQPPAGAEGGRWWEAAQASVAAALWDFTGVGVANLLWGVARLRLQLSPQLGQLLLWQAHRRFPDMDAQLLASLGWAVARLQLRPRLHWLHHYGRQVRARARGLSPGLGASVLLSLGALRYAPRGLLGRLLSALQPGLPGASVRDLADILAGLARLHFAPRPDWTCDYVLALRAGLPSAGHRELVTLLHALARLANGERLAAPPDLLAAALARLVELSPELGPGDASRAACSLVYLRAAPGPALLAGLAGAFGGERLASAAPADSVRMLWALGAFGRGARERAWLAAHPGVLHDLMGAAGSTLGKLGPLELRRVLAAAAALGLHPGGAWLEAHEAAVLASLPRLNAVSLNSLMAGYRALGHAPTAAPALAAALAAARATEAEQRPSSAGDADEYEDDLYQDDLLSAGADSTQGEQG